MADQVVAWPCRLHHGSSLVGSTMVRSDHGVACGPLHGVTRLQWLPGHTRRALACVRWSSCFPAQPEKTKPGLGWRGRNAAGRQTQLERTAWPSCPKQFCCLFSLSHMALQGLRCWVWGFPWKTRAWFVCGFFFFSPSSLVILQLDELSILRVLPGFTPKVGLSGSTQSSV